MEPLSVIIMVGLPGSGKTTWAQTNFPNHFRIDGDSLKTSAKVCAALKQLLLQHGNAVVDATNVTKARRKDIMDVCQQFDNFNINKIGVIVSVAVMRVDIDECMARAKLREANGGPHIPRIAFRTLKKNYEEPTFEEGFHFIGNF